MTAGYRVISSFIGIRQGDDGAYRLITIPGNARISIRGPVLQSGLVDVEFDDQLIAVFMRDIEERTEPL